MIMLTNGNLPFNGVKGVLSLLDKSQLCLKQGLCSMKPEHLILVDHHLTDSDSQVFHKMTIQLKNKRKTSLQK